VRLSIESLKSLERMCVTYQSAITDETVSYLHGRGLSDAAIVSYRLGTVTAGGEHGMYRGMVSIPYLTELAGCVGFKFRRPHACTKECEHQKYLTPYPTRIYNPHAFTLGERLGFIAVCEGEFDAIILTAECGIPCVAIPGVETWEKHRSWPLLFQGFSRVLVFRDQDEPGMKLAKRILSDVPAAQLVDFEGLPQGDVTEIYLAWGADAIKEIAGV